MIPRTVPAIALGPVLAAFWLSPAVAQNPDLTGTGGGPASTITAPNTSSVGQTKPPGSAAGPSTPATREQRTETEKKDDQIMKGICIGCGVK